MEIEVWKPKVTESWMLPLEEIRLLPIGDLQYGTKGFDKDRFLRHIEWGMERGCYFVGLGDYSDVASPSNRRRLMQISPDTYESTKDMMDEMMEQRVEELKELFEPTVGRWFGLVSGHHLWEFQDGTTTDTRLASFLQTKYMGDGTALSILQFKTGEGSQTRYGSAKVWFNHGEGSATTPAGGLNRLLRIGQVFHSHVYLMGHLPVKIATKMPWIDYQITRNGRVVDLSHNRVFAITGGFMKAYEVGTKNPFGQPAAGYAERGMMAPTTLGGVLVYIRPRLVGGRVNIDVDVSL